MASVIFILDFLCGQEQCPAAPSARSWHQEPFRVRVGDTPFDVADISKETFLNSELRGDIAGHAGAFLVDMDGDHRRDLVVGGFSGRFRWYRNTDHGDPGFEKEYQLLESNGRAARVNIECCIPPSPVFVDLDDDGKLDLVSGSYLPGYVYWFKGLGPGTFGKRAALEDDSGCFVASHPEKVVAMDGKPVAFSAETKALINALDFNDVYNYAERGQVLDAGGRPVKPMALHGYNDSLGSAAAFGDLDGDGRLDLVFGNTFGEIFWRRNVGSRTHPLFSAAQTELRDAGGKPILDKEQHATVAVADWNGDGLLDIVAGTYSGAVYWLRNTGSHNAPKFISREQLITPGDGTVQWLKLGELPRRGGRVQVQVVDYNSDRKLDIVVGDYARSERPRTDLSAAEQKEMLAIRKQISDLDRKVGYDFSVDRYRHPAYTGDEKGGRSGQGDESLKEYTRLRKQLSSYLVAHDWGTEQSDIARHGSVWVFLRR